MILLVIDHYGSFFVVLFFNLVNIVSSYIKELNFWACFL